jgi:hypothetical protein
MSPSSGSINCNHNVKMNADHMPDHTPSLGSRMVLHTVWSCGCRCAAGLGTPILLADVAVASPKNIRPEPGPEKIRRLPEERDSFAFGVHASGGARPCLPSRASVSSQLPREKSLAPKCFENPMSSPEISNSIR